MQGLIKRVTIVKMRINERCGNSGGGNKVKSLPYEYIYSHKAEI